MRFYRSGGDDIDLDDLHTYHVLTQGDRYIPFVDVHPLGAVTLVYPEACVAGQSRDRLLSRYPDIKCSPLGDPWKAMRKAAAQALAGFQVHTGRYGISDLFLFMVRAEEAGAELPTILTHIVPPGQSKKSISRTGLQVFSHNELLHWTRFDRLDRNPALHRKDVPFPEWRQGDPFYEIVIDDAICTIADVPVMGSWIANKGAVPFFTSAEDAQNCFEMNVSTNVLLFIQEPGSPLRRGKKDNRGRLSSSAQIIPIYNLKQRVEQIREMYGTIRGHIDVCINPTGRRDQVGWGSLFWGDEFEAVYPVKDTRLSHLVTKIPGPWIRSSSGLWRMEEGNRLTRVDPVDWWTGFDTFYWSGGQVERLLPLSRSLAGDMSRALLDLESDALDSEVLQVVEEFLDRDPEEDKDMVLPHSRLNWFVLVHRTTAANPEWVKVAEPTDAVIRHIRNLVWFERTQDRPMRVTGTIDTLDCGFPGSHSNERENLAGEAFRKAMTLIATRVITRGYTPSDANDIVTLCNATLKSVHVDLAGFVWDLLTASNDDQRVWLLNLLGFEPDFWELWSDGTKLPVDPRGLALVDCRFGEESRKLLDARSLHFLASALALFDELGHSPGIDYAPITIEIVKVLETELGVFFSAFKDEVKDDKLDFDQGDQNQKSLSDFLFGGKKLMLGSYQHILRGDFGSETGLTKRASLFFRSQPNAEYLLGREFLRVVLPKAMNKYRNGGAHDAPVGYETCLECIRTLVGHQEKPGAISQVIAWKTPRVA